MAQHCSKGTTQLLCGQRQAEEYFSIKACSCLSATFFFCRGTYDVITISVQTVKTVLLNALEAKLLDPDNTYSP